MPIWTPDDLCTRLKARMTCADTFKQNSTTLIDEIVAPLNAVGIPFSSTHGVRTLLLHVNEPRLNRLSQNHDNEPNITHLEEILREQRVAPLSYTRVAPPGIGGEDGPGTYWVPVSATAYSASRPL